MNHECGGISPAYHNFSKIKSSQTVEDTTGEMVETWGPIENFAQVVLRKHGMSGNRRIFDLLFELLNLVVFESNYLPQQLMTGTAWEFMMLRS